MKANSKNPPVIIRLFQRRAPDIRELALQYPWGFLAHYPDGAVLDKAQRVPGILFYFQGIVDEREQNGLYILSGSQNFLLLRSVRQFSPGRAAALKLLPFSVEEIRSFLQKRAADDVLYTGVFQGSLIEKLIPPTRCAIMSRPMSSGTCGRLSM